MDELRLVRQESKITTLPNEPIVDDEVVGKCPWIWTSGRSKGEPCNAPTFDGEEYCTSHAISAVRKANKEAKSAVKVEEKKELPPQTEANTIREVIKVSDQIPIIVTPPNNIVREKDINKLIEHITAPEKILISGESGTGISRDTEKYVKQYVDNNQKHTQEEVLTIMKNFSIAIVGLIEILKK